VAMFTKDQVKRWRRAVHKEFRWWRLPSEDPAYRAGMVLAAVYGFGTDVAIIAEVSGQTVDFIRAVLKRARATRLLTGQTLRVGWNTKEGAFALLLDAMVAEGSLSRPPDEKRSAAAKARPRGPDKKPRARRLHIPNGAMFSPKVTNSDPFYGLSEWEKKK
jgi:hypothetical protein